MNVYIICILLKFISQISLVKFISKVIKFHNHNKFLGDPLVM